MDAELARSRARRASVAVAALLVASVLVLLFREALFTGEAWAWAYVGLDLVAIALVGYLFWRVGRDEERAFERVEARELTERRPSWALQGAYSVAGLGVIGALAELGDQLFG